MRIVILTQDDPFYLAETIDYFLKKLPGNIDVAGCVVFDVSPFGRKASVFEQAVDTIWIFGFRFFVFYALQFARSRLDPRRRIGHVLKSHSVPHIRFDGDINSPDALRTLADLSPDLLVSIAGNQVFQKPLIDLAPKSCINLHTSLLPKYRGLMPTFWVLLKGEERTGVSVFFVDEKIDNGPIIVQREVSIGDSTQRDLIRRTKLLGMDCLVEAIELIGQGNPPLMANPASESTYFSKPTSGDVKAFLAAGNRFF